MLLSLAIFVLSSWAIIRFRWTATLIIIVIVVTVGIVWFIWEIIASANPVSDDSSIFSTWLNLTVVVIGLAVSSTASILKLLANHRRERALEKRQSQKLFVDIIQNLRSKEEIIRIEAIQSLGQLANDSPEDWNDRVAEIFCAYVKNTTGKSDYQAQYSFKPSVEITKLMEILTEANSKFDTSKFDLTKTYLAGLKLDRPNLAKSKLNEAVLTNTKLKKADLAGARLAGADLSGASLFRAKLAGALLNEANLTQALLNKVNLTEAWLLGANLTNAELKYADMTGALLGETILSVRADDIMNQIDFFQYWSNMSDTWNLSSDWEEALSEILERTSKLMFTDPRELTEEGSKFAFREAADLTGANLLGANLKRAELTGVILNGTNLSYAELEGSNSSSEMGQTWLF